jgi:Protein of unknown function (DUF1822)
MLSTIAIFQEIYPKHVLIEIKLPQMPEEGEEVSLARVDLNQICIDPVKQWIATNFDLTAKPIFPCWLDRQESFEFISKLVNGFVLQVGEHRIIFIPSDAIDLEEFEVPQEWVDLPNWAGSYYVPIRVDLEHQFLHLWGFISHQDLQERAARDPIFRTYHVNAADTIANLDLLQADYELSGLPSVAIQTEITAIEAAKSIEQIQQRNSQLSPRLDLPFPTWGAILNEPQWLLDLLHPAPHTQHSHLLEHPQVTHLSALLKQVTTVIGNRWRTVEELINPSQPSPAWRSNSARLRSRLRPNHFRGIPLTTPTEIKLAIAHLYESQSDLPTPTQITGGNDLISLIHHSPLETVRWKAVEYLRSIEPTHPILPTQPILDLGIGFQGEEIALVVSTIEKPDRSLAISIQLYPIGESDRLPSGLELSLKDEHGEPVLEVSGKPYIATVRADAQIGRIQLYFVADRDERFSACITLDETQIVEEFRV